MNEVKIVHDEEAGSFLLMLDDKQVGRIDFNLRGNRMRIPHTEVDKEQTGKGFAKMLVDHAIAYARENEYKIIPICPYVVKYMRDKELYKDVLFEIK